MAAARAWRVGELRLDIDEHRPRDVSFEVRASAEAGIVERPANIDEAVVHV